MQTTNALVVEEGSLTSFSGHSITLIGPGAEKCKEVLGSENFKYELEVGISAKGMVSLSESKFNAADFEDVAYFEPAYLKDFVAGKPKKLI